MDIISFQDKHSTGTERRLSKFPFVEAFVGLLARLLVAVQTTKIGRSLSGLLGFSKLLLLLEYQSGVAHRYATFICSLDVEILPNQS